MTKSEILFYYESRQNPNGDPDSENQPRLMHDETIMVTDVRIKRTIRDYAKQKFGYKLFVDYNEKGEPVTADSRAKEIANYAKDNGSDYIKILLENTFDVPLFGALVTIRKQPKKNTDDESGVESGSQKITGPVQFGIGKSVNKVNLIQPTITSRFVGSIKEEKEKQHSTIGKFYAVEYALIKISGAINPINLGGYLDKENKTINDNFVKYCNELPGILFDGTTQLVTRSKYPQRSILFIQVDYKDTMYNDLSRLVKESDILTNDETLPTELNKAPFDFTELISTLNSRKDKIKQIKVKFADDISEDISNMISNLTGITVKQL